MTRSHRELADLTAVGPPLEVPTCESNMPRKSKSHATSGRHQDRLALGDAAILPIAQAVALMPMSDHDARRWLRGRGLVLDLDGRSVVVWADVLDALRGRERDPQPSPRVAGLVRANLDGKE